MLILDEPTEGIQPSIIKDIGRVIRMLADQGLVVERMEWMRNSPCPGHQLLVLTDEAPQGALDLAVHALQALPEVAGPCVQWRVELLAG